jgi:hypothetical protein
LLIGIYLFAIDKYKMLMDKFDFLESLMREEFPENQEKAIVSTITFKCLASS